MIWLPGLRGSWREASEGALSRSDRGMKRRLFAFFRYAPDRSAGEGCSPPIEIGENGKSKPPYPSRALDVAVLPEQIGRVHLSHRRAAGCQWQPCEAKQRPRRQPRQGGAKRRMRVRIAGGDLCRQAEAPTELRVAGGNLAKRSNDRGGSRERQARLGATRCACLFANQ